MKGMNVEIAQVKIKGESFTQADLNKVLHVKPHLVTVFGATRYFQSKELGKQLKELMPDAHIVGCSTAGEIGQDGVSDNQLVITGVHFANPNMKICSTPYAGLDDSKHAGEILGKYLNSAELKGLFVLGQGLNINGSELVAGIKSQIPKEVLVTGGLAGDAANFKNTFVLSNETVEENIITAVGFYDKSLNIGFGSVGGWEPFGPVRRVTKSMGNILYQLDNEPALEVYKKYLGDHAKGLPATGLLFPFALLKENGDQIGIIRTILAIDEANGSLTFAGDIPDNSIVRLMTARNSNLVEGASNAAKSALSTLASQPKSGDTFAILISCVGRKLVMADETEDEIDAAKDALPGATVTGFYSYGEICPFGFVSDCKLHNQTMTVTYFSET